MDKNSKDFFFSLLSTPSPTGFEQPIQSVVRERMKEVADFIETDLHGNVIVGINTKAPRKVMLAGHCDQIGFIVEIGDPVTYELRIAELGNDLVASPGIDDKSGLFVAMETLRLCAKAKKLNVGVYAVSTVQEEVGLRGAQTSAFNVDPEVGIAIDVDFATDNPGSENPRAPELFLGKGAGIHRGPSVNPVVEGMLVEVAKKKKIPFQFLPHSKLLGNDASAIQVTRSGVAAASIGIPNRYMHTQVEVCSLKDLEYASNLLAAFIQEIKPSTDFRPR